MPMVKIDASQLDFKYFIIPTAPPPLAWLDASTVQTINLPVGTHSYQIASGSFCDFSFTVAADGTVGYPPQFASFLSGVGTNTLKLNGFAVTLDARYLTGLGFIWANIPQNGWIQYRQCRLLPFSYYDVQQGSGIVCNFQFALDGNGHFKFAPAMDYAAGGFLRGQGTTRLELLGFPLLVDARNAGGAGVLVQPIGWGVPFAYSGVTTIIVLPASGFRLQFESGIVTDDGFDLLANGTIVLHDVGVPNLALDTFHGLARLTVRNRLPRPLPPIKPA